MAIYERLSSDGRPGSPAKIPVHPFSAALGEWAAGNVTRQEVIDAFSLAGDDLAEIDAIAARYTGFGTTEAGTVQKVAYLWQIERAFVLAERGLYTKAKTKAVLGF